MFELESAFPFTKNLLMLKNMHNTIVTQFKWLLINSHLSV